MWRFVLRENIRRFRELLAEARSEPERGRLASLLAEAEAELTELEALSTPEQVRQNGELRQITEQAVGEAMQMLGTHSASLQLYRAESESLQIVAQRNLTVDFLHRFGTVHIGDGSAWARCFETNNHVAIGNVWNGSSAGRHLDAVRAAGMRAVLCVPLRDASSRSIGILSVHYALPRDFSDDDLARVQHLVDITSAAIIGAPGASRVVGDAASTRAAGSAGAHDD